jgi:hypothetical protein
MDLYCHVGIQLIEKRHHQTFSWGLNRMDLLLQFGYGMMEHCRALIAEWGGGTALLSPRDLTREQLVRLSSEIHGFPNGQVLLDPQFYLPHADHERLRQHEYWPESYSTSAFWEGSALSKLLSSLVVYNQEMRTSAFVLPGLLASTINDDWIEIQRSICSGGRNWDLDKPIYATIALTAEAASDQDQIHLLLEKSTSWNVDGYYIVCEHPGGSYLVDDANWLANILDLVAGLKLRGAKVILGYCNHQMLIASLVKVNAICSGTWMNVRSFPPDKFRVSYDEEIKQRATWYYCPNTLSEYKIPFLDIAHRLKILSDMRPSKQLSNKYIEILFSGKQPSVVGFTEQSAFRHYLTTLRSQALSTSMPTFDETVEYHEDMLDAAEKVKSKLSASGIRGQFRDFGDIFDVNRAALETVKSTRGSMLRRKWSTI